eukprot:COSAG06_NODE_413_length_16040_cov_8.901386_23_plen_102_part_00
MMSCHCIQNRDVSHLAHITALRALVGAMASRHVAPPRPATRTSPLRSLPRVRSRSASSPRSGGLGRYPLVAQTDTTDKKKKRKVHSLSYSITTRHIPGNVG